MYTTHPEMCIMLDEVEGAPVRKTMGTLGVSCLTTQRAWSQNKNQAQKINSGCSSDLPRSMGAYSCVSSYLQVSEKYECGMDIFTGKVGGIRDKDFLKTIADQENDTSGDLYISSRGGGTLLDTMEA